MEQCTVELKIKKTSSFAIFIKQYQYYDSVYIGRRISCDRMISKETCVESKKLELARFSCNIIDEACGRMNLERSVILSCRFILPRQQGNDLQIRL